MSTTTYGRPTGPNTDAHSIAHAEELTEQEHAGIEREEYELYKAHMADAERKVQLDRMSSVAALQGQLNAIKQRAPFDPILREVFDQLAVIRSDIAALNGEKVSPKFAIETFPLVADARVKELLAAPLPPPVTPTRWAKYKVPQHLVAEDAARAAAEKAAAAQSLATKAAQLAAEKEAVQLAAQAAADEAADAANEAEEVQANLR